MSNGVGNEIRGRARHVRDQRFGALIDQARDGGDAGEIAVHSLWIEYGHVFGSESYE